MCTHVRTPPPHPPILNMIVLQGLLFTEKDDILVDDLEKQNVHCGRYIVGEGKSEVR